MPPSAGSVQLEVVAKVDQALQRLAQLEQKVQGLGTTLAGIVSKKIEIDVSAALQSIASVTDKLQGLKALAGAQGSIVLKADASQVVSEVQRAQVAVETSVSAIKAKVAAGDPFEALVTEARVDFRQVTDELDKLDKATTATFERLKKAAQQQVFAGIGENAQKEAALLNAEFQKLERNFEAAVAKLNQESRRANFDPASASAKKLQENIRLAGEDLIAFANKTRTSTAQAGGDFKRLEEAEVRAAAALKQFAAEAGGGVQGALAGLRERFFNLTTAVNLFLASLVVQKIKEFFESATEAAVKIDLLRTALTGLLGSPVKANEQLDFLRKTADELGLSFITLVENFRKFAPAATAAGLSLQETDDVFKAVAVSARALGFSTEETERALLAFQQILQKGKFQAEELTRQLGQLLPNAVGILGKELNKSNKEVLELVKAGKLGTDALLALSAGLVQAFGPTAIGNAHAAASEIERFKNAVFDLKTQVGEQLLPSLIELLSALKDAGREGKDSFEGIGSAAGTAVSAVARAVKTIRDVTTGNFKALTLEIEALIVDVLNFLQGPFENAIELLVVGLHKLGVVGDEEFSRIKESFLEFDKLLKDLPAGLRASADEARGLGDTFANSLTGANKRIEKENKALLDRLRAAQKEHNKAVLDGEETLTKGEKKELASRERAFEAFFEKLQKLAEKPIKAKLQIEDGTGGQVDALEAAKAKLTEFGQKIVDLRKQLAELLEEEKALERQPTISTDELNRAEELRQKIGSIKDELRLLEAQKAGGEQTKAFNEEAKAAAALAQQVQDTREKISAALTDLIARNDAFAASFQALDKKSQDAVRAIVRQFEELNRTSQVTDADLQAFGTSLLNVFTRSGAVSAEFAARLQQEFGAAGAAAGGASEALRVLAAESDKTSAGMEKLAGSAGEAAKGQDALTAATARNQAGLEPLGDTILRVDAATGRLQISTDKTTGAFRQTDPVLQQLIGFYQQHEGVLLTAKEAQDQFGVSLETAAAKLRGAGLDVIEFKDKLGVVTGAADQAGGGFARIGDKIIEIGGKAKEAGKGLDEAGTKVDDLGKKEVPPATAESVAKVGKAGEDAATGLDKAGKAADAAKTPLEAAATAAEKLSKATIPAELADGLVSIGAAAKVAAEPLNQAAAGADRLSAGLKGIASVSADGVTQLATAIQALAAPLTAAGEPAAKVGAALTEISTAVTSIGDAADAVATSLGAIGEAAGKIAGEGNLEKIGEQLTTVDTAAAALGKDLDLAATSLQQFNQQAEPTAATASSLQKSFEGLNLKRTVDDFNGLNTAAGKVAKALDDAGAGAERLGTGLKDSRDQFGEVKKAAEDLGTHLRGPFKTSLAAGSEAANSFAKSLDGDTKAVDAFLQALRRLKEEGIPIIQAAAKAVQDLNGAMEHAIDNAQRLAEETGKIKIP